MGQKGPDTGVGVGVGVTVGVGVGVAVGVGVGVGDPQAISSVTSSTLKLDTAPPGATYSITMVCAAPFANEFRLRLRRVYVDSATLGSVIVCWVVPSTLTFKTSMNGELTALTLR